MASIQEALAEAGHDVFVLVRASDLYPVFISGSFERMFGLAPSRLEDDIEALYHLMKPAEVSAVQQAASRWDKGAPLVFDFAFAPVGCDEERHVRCTVDPVQNATNYLVTFNDVTLERERVHDLEEKLEVAIAEVQVKADFLSKTSHEIRTPLNGIIGLVDLVRDRTDEVTESSTDLDQAAELGKYLLSLVNDILDMSRLESGKVELEQLPFDVAALARDLKSMFESQATTKGIDYTVELQDCRDRFLVGDRLRLSQIIVNLISNSIKFTPEGGHVSVLFKEMYRTDSTAHLMIRVRDTGKGMDPKFLGRIFKPFEQENAGIAGKFGGSGLGMAIADSLITLMGGEIIVSSQLGEGSEFSVHVPFPIASDQTPAAGDTLVTQGLVGQQTDPVRKNAAPEPSPFEGLRTLMAEDNDVNAKISTALLTKHGTTVERVRDGQEALDAFLQHEPGYYDVILMDIHMPNMDGWEATRRIRDAEKTREGRVPIIALSANAYVEDARHSKEMGMDGHVGKPIQFKDLESQLKDILKQSG